MAPNNSFEHRALRALDSQLAARVVRGSSWALDAEEPRNMKAAIRSMLIISVLAISSAAHAECKRNTFGVFEDIECVATALGEANKELDSVLSLLRQELDAVSLKSLHVSQEAWVKYRAAEAGFVHAREGNGSSGRLIVANNSEQATRARVKELRQWLKQK